MFLCQIARGCSGARQQARAGSAFLCCATPSNSPGKQHADVQSSFIRRRRLQTSAKARQGASVDDAETIPPFYPRLSHAPSSSSSRSGSFHEKDLQLPDVQVDHLVIGGGVVGLAIAHQLAQMYPEKTTFLVERNRQVGQETSSRNSEVIHAGIFYAPSSLKTNLCLRGRELMYAFCQKHGVPFRQTGKLVVGTQDSKAYLQGVMEHAKSLAQAADNRGAAIAGERHPPPLELLSGDEARSLEPDLGPGVGWTLHSPRTGIVSSHELMSTLERYILDSENAEIVFGTSVVGLRPLANEQRAPSSTAAATSKRGGSGTLQGWIVETQTSDDDHIDTIFARHVVNASGLNGPAALNSLARANRFSSGTEQIGAWFSKGNYASYSKVKGGVSRVQRLIYPLPDMGKSRDEHGHQGLGTHLTLDMDGNVKFGPDTDWLRPPKASQNAEWWANNLAPLQPTISNLNKKSQEQRLAEMHASVSTFLPNINIEGLAPDYAGLRPKLTGPGGGFVDFTILYHSARNLHAQPIRQLAFSMSTGTSSSQDSQESLFRGFVDVYDPQPSLVTLCGIESPGLTSSLAIAETIAHLIARRGWGEQGSTFARKSKIPLGARSEEAGPIDEWA